MVPPREGNEARRDGRRGIGAPHSTGEAGESGQRDPVEGRGRRQLDPLEGQMANTPRLGPVSTKRQRIAELASHAPEMVFTSLAHYVDMHVLRAAYAATRKDGAVGLDGQTAADYAVHLEANLQSLRDRFKSGRYVAPPVRRVHIPKGDGRTTRPIGIPTFEDKVLQRAVVMVLESVYEQDFRDCSFGFRRRWCTDRRAASTAATRRLHDRMANEAGRPSSVMRFRMLHAIAASLSWAMGCRARSRPPMIDLYLKKAFSTRACRW